MDEETAVISQSQKNRLQKMLLDKNDNSLHVYIRSHKKLYEIPQHAQMLKITQVSYH